MLVDTCLKHVALTCVLERVKNSMICGFHVFIYGKDINIYTKYRYIYGIYGIYHFLYTDCDKPTD
jgi:hypothetical protein